MPPFPKGDFQIPLAELDKVIEVAKFYSATHRKNAKCERGK